MTQKIPGHLFLLTLGYDFENVGPRTRQGFSGPHGEGLKGIIYSLNRFAHNKWGIERLHEFGYFPRNVDPSSTLAAD